MERLAIERQREACENLAKFRRWEVVETYVDQSISASDKTKKHSAYMRMVADYEAGLLDAIVCYDLDRLTRQPCELEDWIDRAESRGLLLVTANGDTDLSADGGRMYACIKAAVARAEVERKGAQQSRAHVQRARQGRSTKDVRPLGYTTSGEVIPHEAEAVRAIYAAFLRGDSLQGIARALSGTQSAGEGAGVPRLPLHSRTIVLERNARREAEGKAPRPVPDDGQWSASTVRGILSDPRYAGYSVYTPKGTRKQEAGESRRRALRDNLVKDEHGELVLGQWDPIVEADQWWTVQNLLDDPARVTNCSGATVRKHLGAGLYRCAECGEPVRTRARYYSCKQDHLNRTRDAIDDSVRALVVERLGRKDLNRHKRQVDPEVTDAFSEQIAQERARIARAERDYDSQLIEGEDLARIRDAARAEITRLEAERLASGTGTMLAPILGTPDPAAAFLEAPIALQRTMIGTLMTVTLRRAKQGKKGFDPESVDIAWK